MRYSILFVIVLVLVSGFIAYFGDLLGRKMGKKRLTMFRLRPRHTAIFVTTITGMVISALVLAALLSVNVNFREAFTQWETVVKQRNLLASESSELASRNMALQKRSKRLEQEATKLQVDADKASKTAAAAMKAKNAALTVIAGLKSEITKRKGELDALRKRSNAAESELAAKASALKDVQKRLQVAQGDYEQKLSDLRIALVRLTTVGARLTTVGAQLTQTRAELTDTQTQLAQAGKALDEQHSTLQEQHKRLVELGNSNLRFERETSALRNRELELRSSELIFRQGDELCRGTISPRQSLFAIKGDLFSLLGTASTKAEKVGAKVGENQRAVQVIYLIDSQSYLGERECIEMALNSIAGSRLQDSDTLVQVVCARNTIAGEQTPVELRLYLNSLVYPKGKLITRSKIDGRESEGRILLSVINFLQTDVSQAALRAGIIPVSNPDQRVTSGVDPGTQVEGLMTVVDRIKAENAPVKLDAFASSDIHAVGPMNMDNMRFNVTKVE